MEVIRPGSTRTWSFGAVHVKRESETVATERRVLLVHVGKACGSCSLDKQINGEGERMLRGVTRPVGDTIYS